MKKNIDIKFECVFALFVVAMAAAVFGIVELCAWILRTWQAAGGML